MPLEYRIDHSKRMIYARIFGVFVEDDIFNYQREVWSQPEVAGFDELLDMSDVTEIVNPNSYKVQKLAHLASAMQPGPQGRFAVVAPGDVAYGIARMYQTYRSMTPNGVKEIGVFRNMKDALFFLEHGPEPV